MRLQLFFITSLHTARHSERGSQCSQYRNQNLHYQFPSFLLHGFYLFAFNF